MNPGTGPVLTFEDVSNSVCSTVESVNKRITKKICSHFNEVPLTFDQVTKYCDWNWEIELWFRPLPDRIQGLTIWEQGMFIVICNDKEKDPLVRAKIILHELGHYLLHRRFLENGVYTRAGGEWFADQFEKEANLFALMAVVPDKCVTAICEDHDDFEDKVSVLQDSYAFTREEAVVRLAAHDARLRNKAYWEFFEQVLEKKGP